MTAWSAAVRRRVDDRDQGQCLRCGRTVTGGAFSRHHRKPRGMGGGNRADAGRLSNIVTLCGTATTPGSCHLWVESNRAEALAQGWLVSSWQDPAEVPIVGAGVYIQLHDDGLITVTDRDEEA